MNHETTTMIQTLRPITASADNPAIENIAKRTGHRLTNRDQSILKHIAVSGFSTVQGIRDKFFNGKKNGKDYRRLSVLKRFRFIEPLIGDNGGTLGYRLTKRATRTLVEDGLIEKAQLRNRTCYRNNFKHDNKLVEVSYILRSLPNVSDFMNETQVRRYLAKIHGKQKLQDISYKVPDALFKLKTKTQSFKVALEVEIAPKSLAYRRRTLRKLMISNDFDLIFMVVANANTLNRIEQTLADVRKEKLDYSRHRRNNGFYFAILAEVLANKENAQFKGEEFSFTLQGLAQ